MDFLSTVKESLYPTNHVRNHRSTSNHSLVCYLRYGGFCLLLWGTRGIKTDRLEACGANLMDCDDCLYSALYDITLLSDL